uniref:Uncharacterized protein n=1 Tax=Knipowitschia caucasica TaxID=637954 RepID=A0AAV2LXQ1_KNICA
MKTAVAVPLHGHEPLLLPGRTFRLPPHPAPLLHLQLLPLWAPRSLEPPELNSAAVGEGWVAAALVLGSANAEDRLEVAQWLWARSLEADSQESRALGPVRTRKKELETTVKMSMRTLHDRLWTLPLSNR